MRGFPGAGKSTLVKEIVKHYTDILQPKTSTSNNIGSDELNDTEDGEVAKCNATVMTPGETVKHIDTTTTPPPSIATICSADDLFIDPITQQYIYDATKVPLAHRQCYQTFVKSVESRVPLIVIDNTNLARWHYKQYLDHITRLNPIKQRITPLIIGLQLPDIDYLTHGQLSKIDVFQYRNIHGVSRKTLMQGWKSYQGDKNAIKVVAVLTLEDLYAVKKWKKGI